jgi:hypothetical protein
VSRKLSQTLGKRRKGSMSSLASIQTQFTAYDPATVEQTEIKAVLAVYINADPQIPDDECICDLREDLLPPSLLYSGKSVPSATILHRLLRDYLQLKGMVYTQSTESTRITYGLVTMLYESESDCDTALALLRSAQLSTSDNATNAYSSEPSNKIAHSMATRFKAEQKFAGKLGEELSEYISNNKDAANDYNLSAKQKLDYMHRVLDGKAKRFYREKILLSCATFAEATGMMQEEFNSLPRQSRVRKLLQKLRISTIVGNRRCSVTEVLKNLREIITKLTPQGPRTHSSEEGKVEYLYKAVVGATWAKSVLSSSQSASPPWDFQTLYAALDAAWLQEQEEVEPRQFDGKMHGRSETTVDR